MTSGVLAAQYPDLIAGEQVVSWSSPSSIPVTDQGFAPRAPRVRNP